MSSHCSDAHTCSAGPRDGADWLGPWQRFHLLPSTLQTVQFSEGRHGLDCAADELCLPPLAVLSSQALTPLRSPARPASSKTVSPFEIAQSRPLCPRSAQGLSIELVGNVLWRYRPSGVRQLLLEMPPLAVEQARPRVRWTPHPPRTPPRPCCLPARCMAISFPLCATSEQTRLSSYQTPLLRGALSRRMNVALRPARYLVAREAAAGLAEVAARHHAHTFNTVKAQIEAEVSPRRDLAASDRDPGVISIPAHAISGHLPPGRGGAKRGAAQGCRDRRRAAIPARLPACIRRSADDVGSRRTCSAARAHQH